MTNDEIYHFGTKGMKMGIRRYQNKDGTLTEAGKKPFNLNARIAELESLDLDTIADIARSVSRIDTNNTRYNKLQERYVRIGRRYFIDEKEE